MMDYRTLTTNELLQQAEASENVGDTKKALEFLRIVIERMPEPGLICHYGVLAEDSGEWTLAEEAYLYANRLKPEMIEPYGLLGLFYKQRNQIGDLELAHHYYKKVVEIGKRPSAYCVLGGIQNRLGLRGAAIESFQEALNLNPNLEEANYMMGLMYKDEDPEKAITFFRKALQIDPDYQLAHKELGWAFSGLQQYDKGEVHLRKAIELDENDGWSYLYLGNLLWGKKDISQAEEVYKKAIEIWPNESVSHWCLAHFYEYQGRISEADFFYEKALQLDSENLEANFRFGLFLKDIKETKKAKELLNRVLALDPNDGRAKLALAEIDDIDEIDETENKQKIN